MRDGSEGLSSRNGAFRYRWIVWGVMVLAYMIVFFHRLAAGVVRDDLVRAFSLSATSFGNMASMYLYAYMIMQIPVGMLADSLGARLTVTAGMIVAGAGSFLFAFAPTASLLLVGRFLVGVGVSTVFVSILKIQSKWFREREFGTMSGLTALIGNLGGVVAQTPLAIVVAWISWRTTFAGIGAVSVVLAVLCYVFIRNAPSDMGFPPVNEATAAPVRKTSLSRALANVFARREMLPASIVSGAFSGTYLAFSGAWAVPFLTAVYGMDKAAAKASEAEQGVAKTWLREGMFTDATVDAFVASGGVPVVTAAKDKIALEEKLGHVTDRLRFWGLTVKLAAAGFLGIPTVSAVVYCIYKVCEAVSKNGGLPGTGTL